MPALTGGAALVAANYAGTHVGARHVLTQMALAPDGGRLYIVSQTRLPGQRFPRPGQKAAGAVTVFDAHNGRKLAGPVKVGQGPTGLAASRDGSFVYVANTDSASVSVISTLENATVGVPIPIKGKPAAVFLSADGSRVFVTTDDSLSTIDTATNRVTGSPIPLAPDRGSAAISPDGRRVYLTHPDQGTVLALDTATGKEPGQQLPVGDSPGQLALSQDGHRIYVITTTSDLNSHALVALDLQAGGKVIGRVPLEGLPVQGLCVVI